MKERPILMSTPMVRALLADTKTQTRRAVNLKGLKVRLRHAVRSDIPGDRLGAAPGRDWPAEFNKNGAVAICVNGRSLGLRPGEFDFVCPYADGKTHLNCDATKRQVWTITPHESRLWVRETVWQWGRWVQDGKTKTGKPKKKFVAVGQHVVYAADCPDYPKDVPDRSIIHADEQWIKRPAIFMPRWASRLTLEITDVHIERLQDINAEDAKAEGWGGYLNSHVEGDDPLCMGNGPITWYGKIWESINGADSWAANPWVWALTFKRVEVTP